MRLLFFLSLLIAFPTEASTHRSAAVKAEFQRSHPCPATGKTHGACSGWVKDHIQALDCGGADAAYNLQWQTVADGKAKDRVERIGCKK
jgi:hypothetical protein